jgi:VanZ family protein
MIANGDFNTPAATHGWIGWNRRAQISPDGGYNNSPGVILTTSLNQHGCLRYFIHDLTNIPAFRVSLNAVAKGVVAKQETYQYPRALFFYTDHNNNPLFHLPHEFFGTQKDKRWHRYKDFFSVPASAANVQLYIQNSGTAGIMQVDDVSVIPVRARPSAPWWNLFFGALWTAGFGVFLFILKPWKRRYGSLIMLTVLFILTGILLPKNILNETIQTTRQSIRKLGQQLTNPVPPSSAQPGKPEPKHPELEKPKEDIIDSLKETGTEHVCTIGHFTMFSLLAFFSGLSWLTVLPALKRAGTIFAGLILFAAATEVLQFITADRTARLADMYVDLTGMAVAILLVILLRSIQYAWSLSSLRALREIKNPHVNFES